MRKNSKEVIAEAAISLFNTNGFSGTSMRDIAGKANVNIANISYYFQNKHGLLEYCFTSFFEQYIKQIEEGIKLLEFGASLCLKRIAANLLYFQCNNIQLTRFVLREMSLDSQIVREIMSTYFAKEKYYFRKVLEKGIEWKEFRTHSIPFIIVQFKGMINMPFLNMHYLTEVLHILPNEPYFAEKYLQEMILWIDESLKAAVSPRMEVAISI
jgi:AcrR family transcriptional regulator